FSEYYYGGGADISGAIAQADVLGVFGREGVFAATLWPLADDLTVLKAGFALFRTAGGAVGDTPIHADSDHVDQVSASAPLESQLAKVRAACRALPEVTERPSHGSPAFLVNDKRAFAYFLDNHHSDGRLALWCAAPEGAQAMLVDSNPDHYFLPPYVAHLGWI